MRTIAIAWLLLPALASLAAPAPKEKDKEDGTRILGVCGAGNRLRSGAR